MAPRGATAFVLLVVLWLRAVSAEHLVAVHYEQGQEQQARRALEDKGYQIVQEWPALQAWYVRLPQEQHQALHAATRAAKASVKAVQASREHAAVQQAPHAAHRWPLTQPMLVAPAAEPGAAPSTSKTPKTKSPSHAKQGRRRLLNSGTSSTDSSTSKDDHTAVEDAARQHLEMATAVDAAAALFVAAAQDDLADVPGISRVEGDPLMVLFGAPTSKAVHGATAGVSASPRLSLPRRQSPSSPATSSPTAAAAKGPAARTPAAPAAPAAPAKVSFASLSNSSSSSSSGVFSVCEPPPTVWQDALHPSGRQIIPWGIRAVQALEPSVLAAAAKAPSKVMYCVLDGGVDLSAVGLDLPLGRVSGCIPSASAGTLCDFAWNASTGSAHGMHVLGTLAAQAKAGVGVQGVASQGATVKLVNILGAAEVLPTNRVVRGLTWCEKQLDAAHKQQPGMRMVVSMSVGASNDTLLLKAILDKLAGRGDVLLVAAAGNTGDTTLQYPAGHPGVISVAALTRTLEAAAFSAYNSKVELAAPGGSIASLLPFRNDTGISLQPYQAGTLPGLRSMSVSHTDSGQLVGTLSFTRAALGAGVTYPTTTLNAPLVDCGFGNGSSPCPNAAGAVCLIQRGNNTFCAKSLHCAVGGGVGVVFYNGDTPDVGPCDTASPVYTLAPHCAQLGSGIIPSLSIGRAEGEALKAAMQGRQLTVTMDFRSPALEVPVGYSSGTSMATPHVAGVAGIVWAAAPRNCSAAAIRSVLQQTALDLGVPGRDVDTGYGLVQAAAAVLEVTQHGCGHGQQQAGAGSGSKPAAGAAGSGSKRPTPSPPKQPSGPAGQTAAGAGVESGATGTGAAASAGAAAAAGSGGAAVPSPPQQQQQQQQQQQGPPGQDTNAAASPALPGSSYVPLPRSMFARSH